MLSFAVTFYVRVKVCVCVCACVRACVRARVVPWFVRAQTGLVPMSSVIQVNSAEVASR